MTLTAKTQTVNTAMAHLGEPAFAAIDTDPPGSALAKVLGQLEGPAGVEAWALSRHPWLCALTYATLAPDGTITGNWKWTNAFLLPTTFARLWTVDGEDVPFELGSAVVSTAERRVIWSNEASLNVAFAEVKPYEAYSPDLCGLIALKLAARTAGPLKSDAALAAKLDDRATAALLEAQGGEAGQFCDDDGDQVFARSLSALRATVA
jgi:hypothetical protein